MTILGEDYEFGNIKEEGVPCKNTLQNWVSKVGFFYLQESDNQIFNNRTSQNSEDLCLIIDESVRVGTEKLLLGLVCPYEKLKDGDLSREDVRVIELQGSNTWKGKEITECITKVIAEKGLKIRYVLSDEGNNLVKASELLGLPHLPDISHLVATCLKKTFSENVEYKAFTSAIGKSQAKLAMGQYAYLRPPKQRAKARFLNQEKVVDWATVIFNKWEEIETVAQEKLEVLQPCKNIIEVLKSCIDFANQISKVLKIKGLNDKNIKDLIKKVTKEIQKEETIELENLKKTFLNYLKIYLEKYKEFINTEEFKGKTIHTCSDIIERLFGIYKAKVSDNYFVTTTTIGLELPLMCLSKKVLKRIIPTALESITVTKLRSWLKGQKSDNQSAMRAKFFKK